MLLENTRIKNNKMTNVVERTYHETGLITATGRLENLFIKDTGEGTFISGSLAIFHYGNNFETLTRKGAERAIESLSDRLQAPVSEARLLRLDIGQNIILSQPVRAYTSKFLEAPYLRRSTLADSQSVYFKNNQKTLLAYDKVSEQTKKHRPIPSVFMGKNVLRYETRFLKHLDRQLKIKCIKARDLSRENFYIKAVDNWQDSYFKIKKVRKDKPIAMKNVKALKRSLIYYGLENIGGYDVALSIIKMERETGNLEKQQYYRLKNELRDIASNQPVTESETNPIEELDKKVKMAAKYYR